jgi:hypothetical protein
MKASILDLRRRMRNILRALDRRESVTLFYRGKKKAVIEPILPRGEGTPKVTEHSAFGMWKDRPDMEDVAGKVRELRKPRANAI